MESIANNDASPAVLYLYDRCAVFSVQTELGLGLGQGRAGQGRAGQGRAGQGRAGQGRAGQGRASNICSEAHVTLVSSVTKCFCQPYRIASSTTICNSKDKQEPLFLPV